MRYYMHEIKLSYLILSYNQAPQFESKAKWQSATPVMISTNDRQKLINC